MFSPLEVVEGHWRPSRGLLGIWSACLLIALAAWVGGDFPLGWKLAGGLGLLVYAAWSGYCVLLFRGRYSPKALRLSKSGCFLLQSGHWQPVQLQASSLVLPWLVVLHYRAEGQWFSRTLCLPADSLDADTHRRLRVRLRLGAYGAGK